ncbi:heterokaryon incompatibility protein-domain-containing protein [Clohesyomyces aquaticus]|uniref:Heterokaryon incompatibility protein-domain-containing protein n=1 Tax=Clohesyomyces aquaticus TaxID=1231657 RepID=A0A1Y2A2T9_9PLEO|nr:heterokaryon incompatibility protein-domain-containing protein [Clohesyomyces aquaticus]
MGVISRIRSLYQYPCSICIVFGIKMLARLRSLINSRNRYQYQYQEVDVSQNQLRLVMITPPYTKRVDEPLRCTIEVVSLNDLNAEFEAWDAKVSPSLPPRKKIILWHEFVDKEKLPGKYNRYRWGDYVALSYTWGSVEKSHWIILDGHLHRVPKNVDENLRSLRSQVFGNRPRCGVWIDYLSINQDDTIDRSQQVMRMQTIYRSSHNVVVHLGEASDDSDLALNLINTISYNISQDFDYGKGLAITAAQISQGIPFPDQKAYMAVRKLFNRPYWRRLWIIQELALADDLSIVLCGNSMTYIGGIRQTMKLLVDNTVAVEMITPGAAMELDVEAQQAAVVLLWWIGRLRKHILLWKESKVLTYLELRSPALTMAQWAKATHQYDKVFGIMGLFPGEISEVMKPLLTELPSTDVCQHEEDAYTKRVFMKFAVAIIQSTDDLDIIFARNTFQAETSKYGLPTWVTDWTLKPDRTSTIPNNEWHFFQDADIWEKGLGESDPVPNKGKQGIVADTVSDSTPSTNISRPWITTLEGRRADGGRKSKVNLFADDELLACQGFVIGHVDGIAPEILIDDAGSLDGRWPEDMVQPKRDMTLESPYKNDDEAANALLRTLLFDPLDECDKRSLLLTVPWLGEEADENARSGEFTINEHGFIQELIEHGWDARMFVGQFLLYELARRRLGLFRLGHKRLKDFFPNRVSTCTEKPLENDYMQLVSNLSNRRLVTMNTGHFGLAPAVVRPHDQIFVILGCSAPVILRKCEEKVLYKVVGECYVDGFMRGEAIDGIDNGSYTLEEITLC